MRVSLAACFLLACTMSTSAKNTFDTPTPSDTSRIIDIDEIVVVSQPKELFKLRMQPLSSTSLGPSDISNRHVEDMRDLSAIVPSFVVPQYGSRLTSAIYVRGVGSRINNPAVGLYYDGIPILGKSAYNTHFYQTNRIDILRGPQGTAYGLNTEGGLLKVFSKSPLTHRGTDVSIGTGSHFYRKAEIAHYEAIGSKSAFSAAGFYNGQNGFLRNDFINKRANDIDEYGGRIKLMMRPSEKLTADVVADYQHTKQNGFAYGELDPNTGATSNPSSTFLGKYDRDVLNTGLTLAYKSNNTELTSTTAYQYLNDCMLMDQDYVSADYMSLEQRQIQQSVVEELSLKGKHGNWWRWTLGGIFSYQWLKTVAPVGFGNAFTDVIAGRMQNMMYGSILNAMAMRLNPTPSEADYARAKAMIERAGGVSVSAVSMTVPEAFHTPMLNVGLFHESSFKLTDRLSVSAGLRFDNHRVEADYDTKAMLSMTASVMGSEATRTLTSALRDKVSDSYCQLLPKFSITYKADDNGTNAYAVVTKGYRAGGFNIQLFSDILQTEVMQNGRMLATGDYEVRHDAAAYGRVRNTIAYKPEVSWNYEAGIHANLFNGTTHVDFSAFYTRISNQQLSVMASNYGFGRMMVNAGKSRSCGIELSLHGAAIDNKLAWSASYGLTHASFISYTDSVAVDGKNKAMCYDGKKVPYVPMHTVNASADYCITPGNSTIKRISIGADITGIGNIYWDEANTYKQNMYFLVGAHADMKIGAVNVSLWGKNLTGTKYNTFAVSSSATGAKKYFAQRGCPLQFGIDLGLHF